jgi:hypothetical protein
LTAGPGLLADQPLGGVNPATLALERFVSGTSARASWDDGDGDAVIDPGEAVYWYWNSTGHTNSLIPLYAYGAGAAVFDALIAGADPVRGAYVDNTAVHAVLSAALQPWENVLFLPVAERR